MFIKVCGTTNLEDALLSVELGADALGFIFAPSRRRVTVEQAAEITRNVPKYVDRVGVFTEPDVETISRTVQEARLSAVQMHWPYDPAITAAVRILVGEGVELWQVVGLEVDAEDPAAADKASSAALRKACLDDRVAVVLLDSVRNGASGGMGVTYSWQRAEDVLRAAYRGAELAKEPKLVVAGGLRAENVRDTVCALRPWGVDVVSGVEASPGKKSPDRLRAFFQRVREAA